MHTSQAGRSRTPTAESRPKTPTGGVNAQQPLSDIHNLSRQDYSRGFEDRARAYTPYGPEYLGVTRPLYDPRLDLSQGSSKRELANHSFSEVERTEYPPRGRDENRREFRSRTPGPDFMRARDREEDPYFQQRSREMRSKTPTHESAPNAAHQPISGTPDFIPASYYTFRNRGHGQGHVHGHSVAQQAQNGQDPRGQRPLSNPDIMQSFSGQDHQPSRLNSSQSSHAVSSHAGFGGAGYNYGGTAAGYEYSERPISPNLGRPRKQSTSFENEEPTPSSLTRIPHTDGYSDSPSGSLDRSRSPTRLGDDKFTEMTVYLKRQENGFGFRIIGGTEEGSQVSP